MLVPKLQISRSEALALGSWASYFNALVLQARGGVSQKAPCDSNGVRNGCGRGPCYIPPVLARTHEDRER